WIAIFSWRQTNKNQTNKNSEFQLRNQSAFLNRCVPLTGESQYTDRSHDRVSPLVMVTASAKSPSDHSRLKQTLTRFARRPGSSSKWTCTSICPALSIMTKAAPMSSTDDQDGGKWQVTGVGW